MSSLLIKSGRVIDPASKFDAVADVLIRNGRIEAVDRSITALDVPVFNAEGRIVAPGFIDMHVHVYEWVTNFGVPADAAGIQSGATTIVDQGSSGAWTFGGFKASGIGREFGREGLEHYVEMKSIIPPGGGIGAAS